jgi:hypothetical protein
MSNWFTAFIISCSEAKFTPSYPSADPWVSITTTV